MRYWSFCIKFVIILGGTSEPNSSEDIGHSDLISGFQGDFLWTSSSFKLEVSRASGYDLCPVNGRTDGQTDGRTDRRTDGQTDGQRVIAIAQMTYSQLS